MSLSLRESANDYVAQEIRAELGRQRLSARELARRMDVDQPWLQKRLAGIIPLRIGEVIEIAQLLKVPLERIADGSAIKRRFSHLAADLRFRPLAVVF